MKLITELIEFALQHGMLTEEHKRKLQDDGFYTFYHDNEYDYDYDYESRETLQDDYEDELDRKYYGEFYCPGKSSGNRHHGKHKRPPVGPKLTVEELNQRVKEDWKKLTEEYPRLLTLWDSWKAGKLERVLADGFMLNDVYALSNVELPDYHEFSGPAPTAYRQLLRQVGYTMGKYSWVIKSQETASMVEFNKFRHQIIEEVRALYETDREKFKALSSQNGKLNFPFWEKAVQTDTTSMKVWTILNFSSKPVMAERIEAIQSWKPELAIALQLDLDYMTDLLAKLEKRDWSSFIVITDHNQYAQLKSVVIPNGVTAIRNYAFSYCKTLTSVVIPEGVTAIRGGAFDGCCSLTSVVIPEGVKWIDISAFSGCSSLTSVAIPKGVTTIGDEAFAGCSSLTSVTIPEGVMFIRYRAFSDCSSLKSVVIPEGVTSIDDYAFSGCSSLTSVVIHEGVTAIRGSAFCGCAAPGKFLLSADGRILLKVNADISGKFVIPESVKVIAPGAFSGCSSLTSVAIPEGVTTIGDEAFAGCSSLTSVTIPADVGEIGRWAFSGCSSLTSVAIPEGVMEIGIGAFSGCSSLTSVAIPEGVMFIRYRAFYDCSSLRSVAIPEGVTEIGIGAFSGCSSLTSVAIPEGVMFIRYRAFYGCSSLTSVVIPEDDTEIGRLAFENCPNLTIHAPAGSYAEKYANENNIPFQPLEEEK